MSGPERGRQRLLLVRLKGQRLASSHFSKSSSPARSVALTTALISVTRSFPVKGDIDPERLKPPPLFDSNDGKSLLFFIINNVIYLIDAHSLCVRPNHRDFLKSVHH